MRVVLDTVVLVRGLINPYGACGEIVFGYALRYRHILSRPVLTELLEVLARPELSRKFKAMSDRSAKRVLEILSLAEVVTPGPIPSISRDPNDNMFLATAAAGQADFLVSEDEDLLVLREHEGTVILRCADFVAVLRERFGRV